MAQLRRIGGHLLNSTLAREGVDLAFKNTTFDSDPILYFDVNQNRVGIKTDAPAYDLDIQVDGTSTDFNASSQAKIDNILINADGNFSTVVGPIYLEQPQTIFNTSNTMTSRGTSISLASGLLNDGDINCYAGRLCTINDDFAATLSLNDTVYVNDTAGNPLFGFQLTNTIVPSQPYSKGSTFTFYVNPTVDTTIVYPPSLVGLSSNSASRTLVQNYWDANISDGTQVILSIGEYPGDPRFTFDRLESDDLYITDNIIGSKLSNTPVTLQASGTGTVEVVANMNIDGDLGVTGNMTIDGNLLKYGNIILGDELYNPDTGLGDTVEIIPDLTQHIVPGDDLAYEFGRQAEDSSPRRWSEMHTPDLTNVGTNRPNAAKVSDQLWANGVTNEIFALQSNDDINLLPDTGITFIESSIKIENNDLTNLINDPVRLRNTGIGYTRFMGTNAMKIPAGNDATRPANLGTPVAPELGDTRWNTDSQRLECFNGLVENITYTSGVVGSLPDQVTTTSGLTTSGYGSDLQMRLTIVSGNITIIEILNAGKGYLTSDTVTVPGNIFLGGATPGNDLTFTVGAQTDDGYRVATGGGAEVDVNLMEDLGNEYSLILG